MIKYATEELVNEITTLFTKIFITGHIPDQSNEHN